MKVLLTLFLFTHICIAKDGYLFVEGRFDSNERWTSFSKDEQLNVKNLIQQLAKSSSGKDLLLKTKRKAAKQGLTLLDVIRPGSGSLTDTTLIRRFSPSRPEHIAYETKSVVYVNRNLNQYDAILDLAHELTHFVYRREFNPYKSDFSLSEFIKNTIEGTGGEVQAFVRECQVLKELFPVKFNDRYNCGKILNPKTGSISYEMAVQKFYQVGSFGDPFKKLLMQEGILSDFPDINDKEVSFVSSAYGVPYPVAAYKEFKSVMSKVCSNDKKRIAYLDQTKKGRTPASEFLSVYHKKCKGFE
ncbi:MAG: hypothetical protein KC478_10520 [Bacteriovoracaceae bacterium]|nr:hypothetical protein [Bacteriovoracaceae bacterium]